MGCTKIKDYLTHSSFDYKPPDIGTWGTLPVAKDRKLFTPSSFDYHVSNMAVAKEGSHPHVLTIKTKHLESESGMLGNSQD